MLDTIKSKGHTSSGLSAKAKATHSLSLKIEANLINRYAYTKLHSTKCIMNHLESARYSDITDVLEFRCSANEEASQFSHRAKLDGSPCAASHFVTT